MTTLDQTQARIPLPTITSSNCNSNSNASLTPTRLTDAEAVEYVRQDAALIGFYHAQRGLGYSVRVALVRTHRRMLETDRQRWQDLLNFYDTQAQTQPTRPEEVTQLVEELRQDFKLCYSEERLDQKSSIYFWFLENWQPGDNSVARSLKLTVAPLS